MTFTDALVGLATAVTLAATTAVGPSSPADRRDATGPGLGTIRTVRPQSRGWVWPLRPDPEVARPFEAPPQPWMPGHRGVDLAAAVGQAVRSPTAGRVAFAGVVAGRGVVVVVHAGGLRSTFEPATGTRAVGDSVQPGDAVGVVAATEGHCAAATCLHWGVLRGRTYLDPLSFVSRAPLVLLPLD